MPKQETLEKFIAMVELNQHDKAIETFYTPDASIQENQSQPRKGRDLLVANERKLLAKVKSLLSECVPPVFVNDNHVVIRWKFRFEWKNGTVSEIEELACQEWKEEKIHRETFFYDPAQFPKQG